MSRLMHPVLAAAMAFAGIGFVSGAAGAEDAPGRYTMTPTENGFIRLDTQTGAMSTCSKKEGEWACKAMPDDQRSLQDKITRLEEENRELKSENHHVDGGMDPNADDSSDDADSALPEMPGSPNESFKLPNEKDLDQAFDYLEGMMKKFRERLKKLEEQEKSNDTVPL